MLRFPVLADVGTGVLTYFEGRMSRGYIYADHLHGVVRDIIAPALQSAS